MTTTPEVLQMARDALALNAELDSAVPAAERLACTRAAIAALDALAQQASVPASRITEALSLPACTRLREWAAIGPAQRAAVESFADALQQASVPSAEPAELWRKCPECTANTLLRHRTEYCTRCAWCFELPKAAPLMANGPETAAKWCAVHQHYKPCEHTQETAQTASVAGLAQHPAMSALAIVRQYPDFDAGGPLAEMMDEVLAGKPARLLAAVEALSEGGAAPQAAPVAPDGRLHADGYFTWARRDGYVLDQKLPCDFWLTPPAPSAPTPELDVRRIMLDVVPGEDGMGQEVYAKSIYDVVCRLADMGQRIEELESATTVQPLTEAQIDILEWSVPQVGELDARPAQHRNARAIERACAAAWGITLAGITAAPTKE